MQYDQGAVRIVLGDILLMDKGQPLPFDEKAASAYLKGQAAKHGTVNIQVGGRSRRRSRRQGQQGPAWGRSSSMGGSSRACRRRRGARSGTQNIGFGAGTALAACAQFRCSCLPCPAGQHRRRAGAGHGLGLRPLL